MSSVDLKNILRVDHHYFHGWHVCMKRRGQRFERYFSDRNAGHRGLALAQALAYRNKLLKELPPVTKMKSTYLLNTTGIIGVSTSLQRTRGGRVVRYYRTSWRDASGQDHRRSFSVLKYGARKAKRLAIEARTKGIAWASTL